MDVRRPGPATHPHAPARLWDQRGEGTGEGGFSADWTEFFRYDDQGRQTLAVSFERAVTQSVYDPVTGRLAAERFFDNRDEYEDGDAPAETVVYQYDAFGRRVAAIRHQRDETGTVTREERWVYDRQGRLVAQLTLEGIVAYSCDKLGRLIRTITATAPANIAAAALALALNPNLSTVNVLSDIRISYDALGRLATVTVYSQNGVTLPSNQRQTTRYQYDVDNRLIRQDFPNGVIATMQYDDLGRLVHLTHYAPDATPDDLTNNAKVDDFQYTLRMDGNWVQVRRTGVSQQ